MAKKLVLAEKPSVAKDLAKILGANENKKTYYEGKNYVITWAYGHLLTLKMPEDLKPEWRKWTMEELPMLPKSIGIKPLPKTSGQLKTISTLAKRKDIDGGIIATDSGRAGELLARWIFEWVRFNKPMQRLWISSQTKKAVLDGFKNLQPAKKYENLYYSELARTKADWLIGLNVTRALTTKYEDNLSAGRVQTPSLNFVYETQEKIEKFMPQTYYTVDCLYENAKARLNKQFQTRQEAQEFVASLNGQLGKIEKIEIKDKSQNAPLPFDLTEIQRVANAMFGYSAKKTLSLVQSLYETHKIVSYPRTDSKYLPTDIEGTLKERLQAVANFDARAKQYIRDGAKVKQKSVFNNNKVTDHYALIPTEEMPRAEKLSSDELRIYRLILERFMGLFADAYIESEVRVKVVFNPKVEFTFKQSKVKQTGWKVEEKQTKTMVDFTNLKSIKGSFAINEELTSPPKALTEGTLLEKMEKSGLGTPATRAEIIEKLIRTELMERNGSALRVTPKGKQLLSLVNASLRKPDLTAKWEKDLELIATGKLQSANFLKSIEEETKKLVKEIRDSKVDYKDFTLTNKICPVSGDRLREKNTKDGKIYVCSNPECNYTRRKEPKVSNRRCPVCKRKMEIIEGNNGAFFRCKYDGTTEKMLDKKDRNKKISKHEERKLMKKLNQQSEPEESPLAAALRKAMEE
ncbi:MAG: DNA topoisomerase 3 [Streptococcaceae bacterium]|jgi:DNA topoisomerase-3|nr:DNA topoisomerase 3 [Streptococcaceae bacterium]